MQKNKKSYDLKHRFIGWLGSSLLCMLFRSLRVKIIFESPTVDPYKPECPHNYVLCLWHDVLLVPTIMYRKLDQYTLISKSGDGEIISSIVESLGWNVVRGSSSRGAVVALKSLLEVSKTDERVHVAITADGPRGPRHVLKEGPLYLASKAGMKIMPIGIAHANCWRAKSWDRFVVPYPFSRVVIVCGAAFEPASADHPAAFEASRRELQVEMDRCEMLAQQMLDGQDSTSRRRISKAA